MKEVWSLGCITGRERTAVSKKTKNGDVMDISGRAEGG